jgi:hypothetical protein
MESALVPVVFEKFNWQHAFLSLPEPNGQHWVILYNDFIAETDASKLRVRVGTLERAIFFRLQELKGSAAGHDEWVTLRMAADNLLEIKTTKLGLPAA